MMDQTAENPKDKWIPWYFVAFFAVIVVLDGFFVYTAISTQTGVVTEQPYEKGLAFNQTLEKAKAQPALDHTVSYQDGILRWTLPMEHASVTALVVRPVQDGHDFEIALPHTSGGIYEAKLETPLQGAWTAQLKAIWDDKHFQTRHDFIAE